MDKQIYKFNAKVLLNNGFANTSEGVIECSQDICDFALMGINDNHDSLLFDQTEKAIPDLDFRYIYVVLDFSKFKNDELLRLVDYPNGFILNIDGQKIRFIEFIKSSSMSRLCKCFYINVEYFDVMHERIGFGFDTNQIKISKWFAYSGLSCSSASLCKDIILNSEDIAIVDDKFGYVNMDCITAISIPYLYELLKDLKKRLQNSPVKSDVIIKELNVPSINEIYHELNCYFTSETYPDISDDTKEFLNDMYALFNLNIKEAIKRIGQIKDKYASVNNENGKINWDKVSVKDFKVKINYFDGCGLISKEFAREITRSLKASGAIDENLDKNHFSFQIRLPFLKGVVHAVDFKDFFLKHNIVEIISIANFNNYLDCDYKDVSKLKMIITKSMFKAATYLEKIDNETLQNYDCKSQIDYYFKKLQQYQYPLGIANKEGKQDDDRQLNYQFLTTLPLDENQVKHLISDNQEKIKTMTSEEQVMMSIKGFGEEFDNDCIAYSLNPDYYLATSRYQDIRNGVYQAAKNDIACGKLHVASERRYLAPDLLALLYHAAGLDMPEDEKLPLNQVFIPYSRHEKIKIKEGRATYNNEAVLLLRNPHYAPNEIVALNRFANETSLRFKYFKHLYGTLMINPLSGTADRLGGADYDGDTVLVVNDWNLTSKIKSRLINQDGYLYRLIKIPSLSESDKMICHSNVVKSFNQTFSSKTGLISNQAFVEAIKKPAKSDYLAYFTILNGLEIDSAKTGRKPKLVSEYAYEKPFFLEMKDEIKKNKKSSYITQDYCQSRLLNLKDKHILYDIAYQISNYNLDFSKEDILHLENAKAMMDEIPCEKDEALKHTISLFDSLIKLDYIRSALKTKRQEHNNNCTLARTKLESILVNKGYQDLDIDEFLDAFNTPNPNETLKAYCVSKIKFHFMDNNDDKNNYLRYLRIGLSDYLKDIVFDFNDEGYQILFLALYYWKENYFPDSLMEFKDKITGLVNKNLDELDEEFKQDALNGSKEIFEDIKHDINWKNVLATTIRYEVEAKLDEYPDIRFNQLAYLVDIFKCDYLFTVFGKRTIDYLTSVYTKEMLKDE